MNPPQNRLKQSLLLLVIYLAFISLGLPDGTLGLAWPAMRGLLKQPLESLGFITFTLAMCSAVASFMSGYILARLKTSWLTLISAGITGFSLLGISYLSDFSMFILLSLPLGFGQGAVDSALNHYVAEHYSSRQMNWLHACWGLGAALGPFLMGRALMNHPQNGWMRGYQTIGALQLSLALILLASLGLWKYQQHLKRKHSEKTSATHAKTPRFAPFLATSLFALYPAIEVGAGIWAGSIFIEARGFLPESASFALVLYYGAITFGRMGSGVISNHFGNRRMIRFGLFTAFVGILLLIATRQVPLTYLGLILLGVGCAPIYPSLMHETPQRFDAKTARKVIGWQVGTACAGAGLIPAAFGLFAASFGLEIVFWLIALFVIAFFIVVIYLDRVT